MKRLFSLSPRLQAVAEMVPAGSRLTDVGTDHGQLPVWLVCQGIVPQAVATDLRPGPLSRGVELAQRWEVDNRISFRLCDGLSAVAPEEAQVVTVAGMGGETIADILDAVSWSKAPGHERNGRPSEISFGKRFFNTPGSPCTRRRDPLYHPLGRGWRDGGAD